MDTEKLIRHVVEDEEVIASNSTSYQTAQILSCALEFIRNQPERSKREDGILFFPIPCEHCKKYIHIDDEIHRFRCGALNTVVTQ